MVPFDFVTGGNRMLSNSGGMTNLSESFEVLRLSIMWSSFSFADAKSITIPATGFVDNLRFPSQPTLTVPKKDVILVLPYLGLHSDAITRRLKSCVNKFYGFVSLRVVFQNTRRIKSFFPYKDRFNRSQKSGYLWQYSFSQAGLIMSFLFWSYRWKC